MTRIELFLRNFVYPFRPRQLSRLHPQRAPQHRRRQQQQALPRRYQQQYASRRRSPLMNDRSPGRRDGTCSPQLQDEAVNDALEALVRLGQRSLPAPKPEAPRVVERAKDYMRAHLPEALRVQDSADAVERPDSGDRAAGRAEAMRLSLRKVERSHVVGAASMTARA